MTIQMTRAEYESKYGKKPTASTTHKTFGQKVGNTATGVSNFLGFKGITDQYGSTIAKARLPKNQRQYVEDPSLKEVVGSAIQGGANFIPGVGELKGLGTGAKIAAKVGAGLGTGYALDVGSQLQDNNKTVGQSLAPGVGTALGGGLPVAGAILKPAAKIVGRLVKGLGSGLSGVSTDTINKIIDNPQYAQQTAKKLAKSGNYKLLEDNARELLNGVTKIQNEASSAYRNGLDKLSEIDIKPEKLKEGFFGALEKNKIAVSQDGHIDFGNADFLDPKVQQKAEDLINTINKQTDLSGAGVRKLMDIVDNKRFKSAPDGDRQAFNAFVGDLKQGLKDGINASTDKLKEINTKYSADMNLSEAAQNIFGGVNFKNLSEVAKAANKLEGLFNEKGIDPQIIDDYLKRIGIDSNDFKTGEAVRQISNKAEGANSPGTSIGEITRSVTSAIITPKMVRDIAIKIGIAEKNLIPFLKKMKPAARNILINALLQQGDQSQQTQ